MAMLRKGARSKPRTAINGDHGDAPCGPGGATHCLGCYIGCLYRGEAAALADLRGRSRRLESRCCRLPRCRPFVCSAERIGDALVRLPAGRALGPDGAHPSVAKRVGGGGGRYVCKRIGGTGDQPN